MPSHAALLSGINLGRRNRLAMSDLRDAATSLGLDDVATYGRSGNLVFTCPSGDRHDLASELEEAIALRSTAKTLVVIVSRAELSAVVASNPFPQEVVPRHLHVVFFRGPVPPGTAAAGEAATERARARGSRDELSVRGNSLYLRTPDGLGRSALASELSRTRAAGPAPVTTMRNWATVTRLHRMLAPPTPQT